MWFVAHHWLYIHTAPESDFARANTGQSRNQHRLTANTETIIYIYIESLKLMGEMRMRVDGDMHIKIYSAERMTISWHWTFNQNPSYWEKKIYIFILCTGSIYVLHILYTWSVTPRWLTLCRVRLCSEHRLLQIKHILFYFILFYVCARTTDLPNNSTFKKCRFFVQK